MQRSQSLEIMDDLSTPEEVWESVYHELGFVHRFLGNHATIVSALRRDPRPIHRVLDIGCGDGALLSRIRRTLAVDVIGVDLRAPRTPPGVPIVHADATRDLLPPADVAICLMVAHHLSEEDLISMIRNTARSVRRLIILDLVRHWLPLALFRLFVCPLVNHIVAVDGLQSVRRSFTPAELRRIVERAVAGTGARFDQVVAPLLSRQVIDIVWS